jgi:hypothetical protein
MKLKLVKLYNQESTIKKIVTRLVAVGKATHTAHDAQHVVVGRIHTHRRAGVGANRVVGHRQQQSGVIDTGQVAGAAGLVLLRLESEGVHVDTHRRHVGVVLEGLHLVEVAALAHLEPVVAVELQERSDNGVLARQTLNAGDGVTRLQDGAVPPVGVVERLLALPGVDDVVIAADEGVALDNPDELLTGVVEVQLELVAGAGDALTARELQSLDQVLVGDLGELAALIRVEVDVVDIQRRRHQARSRHAVADGVGVAQLRSLLPAQVAQVVELQVDAHLVVLEGDQRQGQTRVAVEPELQGDVQSVLRRALAHLVGGVRLATRAVIVAVLTTLEQQVHQLRHVANHLGVAGLLTGLLGELVPDLEPVTIVLVDALATDLQLDIADQVVAHPVEPAELGTRAVAGQQGDFGQSGLEVDAVDQVTIALDRAGDLATETRRAVEGVLDGLHREVSVAAVNHLEESNLRITRQIHILSAVSDELHKTTSCHLIIPTSEKKILAERKKSVSGREELLDF